MQNIHKERHIDVPPHGMWGGGSSMGPCKSKDGANPADDAREDTENLDPSSSVHILTTETTKCDPVDLGKCHTLSNPNTMETDVTRLYGFHEETTLETDEDRYR
jgi:hypothetical protein